MPKSKHRKAYKSKKQAADRKQIAYRKLSKHKQDQFIQKLIDAQVAKAAANAEVDRNKKIEKFIDPNVDLMSEKLVIDKKEA